MTIKSLIRSSPILGPISRFLKPPKAAPAWTVEFNGSGHYWEERYVKGGNSGAGSYNRLARFKAEVLNAFVAHEGIRSVIEFGCGDGAQLKLADYPSYIGVDVSQTILDKVRADFADEQSYRFLHTSEVAIETRADLSLSLDVIYHLVEDPVFETYMRKLFAAAERFVVIYASNEDRTWSSEHVRHRRFTDWIEKNRPEAVLKAHIPNRYPYDEQDPDNTSFADFFIYAVD